MSETDTVAAICGSAHFAYSLLPNLRGIIGEDSDLCPLVFKEQDAAAIFRGEDDPFANRPLIITAFPLGIQYLPVIHFKHIVGRGFRIIVPQYLSSWPLVSSEEKPRQTSKSRIEIKKRFIDPIVKQTKLHESKERFYLFAIVCR